MRLWTRAALAALVVSALACSDRDRDETASRVDSAASDIARLDDATEDGWTDLRAGVERSLERVRDRIDEVTRTGGPMGGRSPGQS